MNKRYSNKPLNDSAYIMETELLVHFQKGILYLHIKYLVLRNGFSEGFGETPREVSQHKRASANCQENFHDKLYLEHF